MAKKNREAETLPVLRIVIEHADGTAVLEPNDLAIMAVGGGTTLLRPLKGERAVTSVISGEPAVVYRASDLRIPLTPDELLGLIAHELRPEEVSVLHETFGDEFEWHDGFYDQRTWAALDPMGVRKAPDADHVVAGMT